MSSYPPTGGTRATPAARRATEAMSSPTFALDARATPRVVSRRARPVRPPPRARVDVRASSSSRDDDAPNRGFGLLEWLGPVVPQGALVTGVKTGWREAHRAMVRELAPQSPEGAYVRPAYAFDGVISPTPGVAGAPHPPEPDRYVAYVGNACPWCHRVTLTIALRGLGDVVRVVRMTDDAERASRGGWVFERGVPSSRDPVFDAPDLRVVYDRATSGRPEFPDGYRGRCTAPLLLDAVSRRPVSNESADIVRMLDAADFQKQSSANYRRVDPTPSSSETDDDPPGRVRLYPAHLAEEIDGWNARTYAGVNDGVYRCGFATGQAAYERAASKVASTLDELDARLATRRFLCGDKVTEADARLFPTIVRHDAVYATLFKCQKRRVADLPNLSAWMRDVYLLPGVAETVDVRGYLTSYFGQLFPLNPGGIVPTGPLEADLGLGQDPKRGGYSRHEVFWLE